MTGGRTPNTRMAFRLMQVITTIVVMAVLWRVADGRQTGKILGSAQPIWLIAGLLALTLQTVLSAIRWRVTAAQLGLKIPLGVAIREYYLSQLINQVVPGGVVGDASRAVRSRDQNGLMAASQAVILERFAGQVAMFAVMAAAILMTFWVAGGLDWPSWTAPIVLPILLGGIGAFLSFALLARIPNMLRKRALGLAKIAAHALLARRVAVTQITLSFATVFCNLAAFAFCARAVGVALPAAAVCALVPLILFTMLIPVTIMGWGLREGAAAMLLPLAGVTSSEGLAASVAFGLTILVASVPGLIPVWMRHGTLNPKKDLSA